MHRLLGPELAKEWKRIGFEVGVAQVAESLEPNRLCNWLHSLAEDFNGFYQACPVLKCPDDSVRRSRLRLCGVVKRALADGLSLLGISAPDRM